MEVQGPWKDWKNKATLSVAKPGPKNPSIRITKAQRNKVIELKKKMPSFGAERLKGYYNLTLSDKAIRKIWKEEGLLKKKRKKHKTKNDLRAVKAAWKLCEQIDIDTKDPIDIPELWPQIQDNGLPRSNILPEKWSVVFTMLHMRMNGL